MPHAKRKKRAREEKSSPQPKKILKLDVTVLSGAKSKTDTFQLFNLPNDELKTILDYLGHEDKKNLKLTSKHGEKRVISVDSSMRTFNVVFRGDHDYDDEEMLDEDLKLTLSKAKQRHLKSGDLDQINISLTFIHIYNYSKDIINEWRENIVFLSLNISGLESHLLDSKFKMPKLKSLDLNANVNDDKQKSAKKVVSALLQNQVETLEELRLVKLDADIPTDLKLDSFISYGVPPSVLISVLNSSHSTLKKLKLTEQGAFEFNQLSFKVIKLNTLDVCEISFEMVAKLLKYSMSTLENLEISYFEEVPCAAADLTLFNSLKLKLKVLSISRVPINVINKVLKLSNLTLEKLSLDDVKSTDLINLGSTQLKSLKEFVAIEVSSENVAEILRCSYKSLECFHFEYLHYTWVQLEDFQFGGKLLNLKEFNALYITPSIAASVIKTSQATLEELRIEDCLGDFFDITSVELPKLKSFTAFKVQNWILQSVIEAAHKNLESLSLERCDPHNINAYGFGYTMILGVKQKMPMPLLTEFRASGVSAEIVATIIKLSDTSLKYLDISFCDFDTEVDYSRHFESKKDTHKRLVLEKLKVDGVTSKFISRLIKCSQETLKHLEWNSCADRIQINQVKFKQLQHFEGSQMLSSIAEAVIKASDSSLKLLSLKNIKNPSGEIIDSVKINIPRNDAKACKNAANNSTINKNIEEVAKFAKAYKSTSKFRQLFDVITAMLNTA